MTILAAIRNLDDLQISVPLPDTAKSWMNEPLRSEQLHISNIRKSSGGYRRVIRPLDRSLKRLQKKLKEFLDRKVLDPHPAVHGFTRKRGAYTNALAHLNAPAVLTVDLSDFFESITSVDIEATLNGYGATPEVARGITNICTFEDVLATGFSTSPVLSNMYFREMDVLLTELSEELDLRYTRYADDLTFSGEVVDDAHLADIETLLEGKRLRLNEKKVRFQRRGHPQYVTGYGIAHSDHPRVPRHFKRQLRQDLYYTSKFGLEHQAKFRAMDPEDLAQRLKGRINYLMCSEKEHALALRREFGHLLDMGDDGTPESIDE